MFSDTLFNVKTILEDDLNKAFPDVYPEKIVIKMLRSIILLGLCSDLNGHYPLSDKEISRLKQIARLKANHLYTTRVKK